jgi:hypothetical protein
VPDNREEAAVADQKAPANTPAEQDPKTTKTPTKDAEAAPSRGTAKGTDRHAVPGAPGVDARLDNRAGDQRPPLESFPAKPQQVDGPDLVHQAEHTRRVLAERADGDDVDRKGMHSAGPHGLSDESERLGGPTCDAGQTAAEAAKDAR